jgi:hypothetical protein
MERYDLEDLSVDIKKDANKIELQDWTGFRWLK